MRLLDLNGDGTSLPLRLYTLLMVMMPIKFNRLWPSLVEHIDSDHWRTTCVYTKADFQKPYEKSSIFENVIEIACESSSKLAE